MTDDEENKSDTSEDQSDEEILRVAKHEFALCVEAESENRVHELDDQRFMVGDQWPEKIRNDRTVDNRPCLTINRLPQFVRQVTNDQRQNRPSIKVNPCDSLADGDTAKIFQGIIRHIEYNSHADIAYDTAFEAAASSGLGYWRIVTDYSDPMSFQQEVLIKRIKDRMSVYVDPFYQEPDGSDIQFGFVFDDLSPDEFKAQNPKAKLSSMADWASLGETTGLHITKDSVRVAEYYKKVWEEEEICLLSDKSVFKKKDLPTKLEDNIRVVSERTALIPKIKWYKINGVEILDRTDIPGQWVPIIPVIGEEFIVNGKRILSGIIRNAKDPQRRYNYWASAETEMIALAPKAPFIGAEGQFEGHETEWQQANTKNMPYLQYKPTSLEGQALPPPQRTQFEPQVMAITNAMGQSADDLKATTGIYDASLGNRSNEQSGVAIQRRNTQAQTGNFHFIDNLSRSLRHTGRILINWIPKVYDTQQAVRVIGDDGEVKMQEINKLIPGPNGDMKHHFLDSGMYDCTVDTGPSFQTKRQESVGSMLDLVRSVPGAMAPAMDLLVKFMDWPGSDLVAERLKRQLPPNITADPDDPQSQIPPQAQAQIQQMSTMIQHLTQELNENVAIIEKNKMELESKERIALMNNETNLKIEILKHDAKDAQLIFETEIERIHKRLDQDLNFQQPIDDGIGGQPQNGDPSGLPPSQGSQPPGGFSPGLPTGGVTPGTTMGGGQTP